MLSTKLTFRVNGLTKFVISCHIKLLNLKGTDFGERIALMKASADFPLQNPQRESRKRISRLPSPPSKSLKEASIWNQLGRTSTIQDIEIKGDGQLAPDLQHPGSLVLIPLGAY